MSKFLRIASLMILAAHPLQGQGQPPRPGEDPLARLFFPPELVLQHAQEIGLKTDQRTQIINLIKEAQGDFLDLQMAMGDRSRRLQEALSAVPVNENAALMAVDSVLATERDMKRRQMRLLIRIKNSLGEEQQQALRRFQDMQPRPEEVRRPPPPPEPGISESGNTLLPITNSQ